MDPTTFACIGETMAQFVAEPLAPLRDADLMRMRVGGAESNVAIYLAALGFDVQWVSRLGADPFGDRVLDVLGAAGVGLQHVERDPARPTGLYFKDPRPDGNRVWYYRRGSAASAMGRGVWQRIGAPDFVHLTGITAAISDSGQDLVRFGLEERPVRDAVYSFDVNHRPALMSDAGDLLRDLASAADIVFVGYDEAQTIWNVASIDEIRHLLPTPGTVVVKDAERGATAFAGDQRWFVPANVVEAVEAVGAGDAFAAGYLAGTAAGRSPESALQHGHDLAAAALMTTGDVGVVPSHLSAAFTERTEEA